MNAFLWLAFFLAAPESPKVAPPSPDDACTRAAVELPLAFSTYLFADEPFPTVAFSDITKARAAFGPHVVKARFYDRTFQAVEQAKQPGPYLAVVEVVPESGRRLTRYFTLFRAAKFPGSDAKVSAESLTTVLGRDARISGELSSSLAAEFKERPLVELAKEPRLARLLTGLSLMEKGDSSSHKWDDPLARERQLWVNFQHSRTDRKPLEKPTLGPRKASPAAPVVRDGTEAQAGMKPGTAAKIDAILTEWAADDDQAFAVCLVRRGVIVLHKAYGTRDGKPMTVTTKSWMASVTKAMSATLMMSLVDAGLIGLDDPVEKYLPAFRGAKVETPLTVRHLYTHTSGLAEWPGEWNRDDLPDIAERAGFAYPAVRVGKEWKYGGQGYVIGGKIMEQVTGKAVPVLFHDALLEPLGCTNTDVAGTHADAFSVPLDMAKFGQLLLNGGSYGERQWLRPETFEKMLPRKLTNVLGENATKVFGVGLDGNPERFGHGAASAATFHVDRPNELVIVMTRNKMGMNQGKYGGKFMDAIQKGIDK